MDAEALLRKHFTGHPRHDIVLTHSRKVAGKAAEVADRIGVPEEERRFIVEAALLHDIGVSRTASSFAGTGSLPYILHGLKGREILEEEGYPEHALVCERHIGVGLTVEDIEAQNLPLPRREMVPLSRAERIVCFADLFFSKKPADEEREKSTDEVRRSLEKFGRHKVEIFERWLAEFGG
jgi:uncharacterized protein